MKPPHDRPWITSQHHHPLEPAADLESNSGWTETPAEPTAREIALGGSFDWLSFGFGLALLIVGIIRLVGREVVVRKS